MPGITPHPYFPTPPHPRCSARLDSHNFVHTACIPTLNGVPSGPCMWQSDKIGSTHKMHGPAARLAVAYASQTRRWRRMQALTGTRAGHRPRGNTCNMVQCMQTLPPTCPPKGGSMHAVPRRTCHLAPIFTPHTLTMGPPHFHAHNSVHTACSHMPPDAQRCPHMRGHSW